MAEQAFTEEDVKDQEVEGQESTPTDSSSGETNSPDTGDTDSQSRNDGEYSSDDLDNSSGEDSNDPSQDPNEPDNTQQQQDDGKPGRGYESRKQQLQEEIQQYQQGQDQGAEKNNEIRELVNERNRLKQNAEQANSSVYQAPDPNQLVGQINPETGTYFNPVEARVAAMEQQQAIERYNNEVAENQLTLQSEAEQVMDDFPMFDSTSEEYNPEAAQQLDQILQQNLVFDQNTGQVVGSRVSPYQLYKAVHDSAQASANAAQVKGQRDTEQMLSNADSTGGAPQGEPSFQDMSLDQQEEYLRKKGHDV